jgi:hypothetical protein
MEHVGVEVPFQRSDVEMEQFQKRFSELYYKIAMIMIPCCLTHMQIWT